MCHKSCINQQKMKYDLYIQLFCSETCPRSCSTASCVCICIVDCGLNIFDPTESAIKYKGTAV